MFNVLNTYININKYKLYAPDKERENTSINYRNDSKTKWKKIKFNKTLPQKKNRHIIESNSGC